MAKKKFGYSATRYPMTVWVGWHRVTIMIADLRGMGCPDSVASSVERHMAEAQLAKKRSRKKPSWLRSFLKQVLVNLKGEKT